MHLMTTALLVMDVQVGIVERYADDSEPLLHAIAAATTASRSAGYQVIYVRVAFRPGAPEISPNNRGFAAIGAAESMGLDDPATQVHPTVAPAPGDIEVLKKRVSAFAGSDLDVVLRSLGVDTLVLTGIATSGVVLSTLRQAADLDYQIVVDDPKLFTRPIRIAGTFQAAAPGTELLEFACAEGSQTLQNVFGFELAAGREAAGR